LRRWKREGHSGELSPLPPFRKDEGRKKKKKQAALWIFLRIFSDNKRKVLAPFVTGEGRRKKNRPSLPSRRRGEKGEESFYSNEKEKRGIRERRRREDGGKAGKLLTL